MTGTPHVTSCPTVLLTEEMAVRMHAVTGCHARLSILTLLLPFFVGKKVILLQNVEKDQAGQF